MIDARDTKVVIDQFVAKVCRREQACTAPELPWSMSSHLASTATRLTLRLMDISAMRHILGT